MNISYISTAVAVVLLCVSVGCTPSAEKDGLGHHHHHHGNEHKEGNAHNHNHEDEDEEGSSDIIHLTPEQAHEFGVKTDTVQQSVFNEVIIVSGEILSVPADQSVASAPNAGIISFSNGVVPGMRVSAGQSIATVSAKNITGGDANENARITYESAKRELDRVTPLHKDGIVSTKDYNAAEENFRKAQAAYTGGQSGRTVKAQRSGIITEIMVQDGEYVETGRPIVAISANNRLTLRADVPDRFRSSISRISTANFKISSADKTLNLNDLNGTKVSESPSVVKGGYVPVYFTFDNDGGVLSGTFAEVYLIGDSREGVISVPVSAVTEQQGEKFVYVRLDEDCYRKVPVVTGATDGCRIEIRSGLNCGDDVVIEGVTFVKLAESSGAVPEGHSHTH